LRLMSDPRSKNHDSVNNFFFFNSFYDLINFIKDFNSRAWVIVRVWSQNLITIG